MRRRITVAILGVVIGTLVLTVVGSLLLVRRAAISTAENELTTEARAIGALMSSHPVFTNAGDLDALRRVGAFDHLTLVGLGSAGSLDGVPAPLGPARPRRHGAAVGARPWRGTRATSSSWPSPSADAAASGVPRRRPARVGRARPRGHPPRRRPRQRHRLFLPGGGGGAHCRHRGRHRAGSAHQRSHRASGAGHPPDRRRQPRPPRSPVAAATTRSWPSWPRPSTPWART